jgi:hypothetical protein
LSLWQAMNEQFYPERADYTYTRSMGMEFASHLMTGVPALASRDLSNAIAAMLRPPGQTWFHPRTTSDAINRDTSARMWLDWAGEQMRLKMYDISSGWSRATKEGDRDYCVIGNACIGLRPNRMMNGLLYKTHHMRDVAWSEDDGGNVNAIHVKRKISVRNMNALFPKTVDPKVKDLWEKNPERKIMCRHIVMPSADYDATSNDRNEQAPGGDTKRNGKHLPFVSIWIDTEHDTILEEIGQWELGYIPPRWETVSGFGYGYAPPTVINIADARMLQQITLTLLEAGQKSVDPPMKAIGELIQGTINSYAGGTTWVDADYDERTGAILEPLMGTQPNLGWGVDREKRIAEIIANGHFLNQIKLPDTSHARTAFEVQKLYEEYIRNTTPLFEPIQVEYNGAACDRTFALMLRMNAFGNLQDMPRILRGQDVHFTFDTPLTVAATRANAQAFTQSGQIIQLGMAIDPAVKRDFDVDVATRDALEGAGAPARWIVPAKKADKLKAQDRAQQAQQQAASSAIQNASAAGDAGAKIGAAANMLQQGGILPPQLPQQGGAM